MSEIWDCYDSQFNLVEGKVLIRGQEATFSEEEYHLVCDITVKHTDGTYLLMQRDFRKEGYPGKWEFTAGGSALQGESPEDGETIDYRWVGKSELLKMKEEKKITKGESICIHCIGRVNYGFR